MKKASAFSTLKKVMKITGRYWVFLIFSIVLAAASVILQLYIPNVFGNAIDAIVEAGKVDFAMVAYYLKRILILAVLAGVSLWVMNVINNRLAFKTVQDIREKAIRKIQTIPLSYLDSHSTGDIVQRVIADVDQLSDGLLLGFTQLFSGVVTIIATLIFMFSRNIWITIIVAALTPVSFIVSKFIASRSYHLFSEQTKVRGRETAFINEMIGNEKVVKAFGYEEKAEKRFGVMDKELVDCSEKAVFFSSLTNPCTRAVNNVIYALVALSGAFFIWGGSLTVGGLSVMLSYANQYMKPFNDISSVVSELQNALACAARIFELIETDSETPDQPGELKNVKGEFEVENVSFSYDKSKSLIEDFSLEAKQGMKIAIVGPTGCGKTTFINLLMRFYDPDKGKILIDDTDISSVTRHSLRSNIGMVLQETWLKNGTVRENIAFGKENATDEEIITAAKEAHSWEFIRRMPEGLDTIVTDESLSQGQKQLLCITRVMLSLPPMLILDEATSSIDTRTEIRIQNAFEKLMNGRTSFIVAHRLSTIRTADMILVMKDGKIIEQGNHDTLMQKNGFYSQLYNSQFAGVE